MGNSTQEKVEEIDKPGISSSTSKITKEFSGNNKVEDKIKKKLFKAKIEYDADNLEPWYELETLKEIFKESIEEDKRNQEKFNQEKEEKDEKKKIPYDYKVKVIFSEISNELTETQKKFVPSFMVPFGFCHAGVKVGKFFFFFVPINNKNKKDLGI